MADSGIPDGTEIARLSLDYQYEPPPPPPPDIRTVGIVPVDITDKFSEAVKTFAPGDLVKDDMFTLFESVAALEIMDPKMDSGCVESTDELEELYDVTRPLLPEEVLGIIDQLLCHEMAWHQGYPLSQTLFTSVYAEALLTPTPRTVEDARFVRNAAAESSGNSSMLEILRAYCLGLLKACGYVNERIRSEHYYEEEDFVTNTYHRTLLAEIQPEDIQKSIQEARSLLGTLNEISDDLREALDQRLQLRSCFLDATECPKHVKEPDVARKPWLQCLDLLPAIKSSHELGRSVDEAFSAKLQRKLASTMPPRPIVQLKFDDAFEHLSRLFKDGAELIDVLNYTDSQSLQTFVYYFQAKKPQPLVFVRTLLQTFLFNEMEILGSMSIRQLLDDDFSIVTLPASIQLDRNNDEIEVLQDPRFIVAEQMELFRKRAAQPFLDIFRTYCQNRCRVRRTLCHVIRDWENLQVDAEEIDQNIQIKLNEEPMKRLTGTNSVPVETWSLPLSSWTYLYKIRQMETIVQLGFELEVYQPDELAGMYWYLNYLAKWRLQHAERIKSFIVRKVEESRAPSRPRDPTVDRQLERSLAFTRLMLLDAAVTWELSDALSCVYTILLRLNLIKLPPRPYSNDELRFDLRMRPFAAIGLPPLPNFQEFTEGTAQPESSTVDVLRYAERALRGAKQGLEALSKLPARDAFSVGSHEKWVTSKKNALKACIATGLAITTVQKALEKEAEDSIKAEVPTPDKCYHDWWIVPRVIPA
ncbi:N-alpha-acetyltransferase, non-catalitic subunit [Fusarium irregulare]|uniref:N-alpha-acetyltransferase, non-catalitic subunit n=1 Tax=Fusarium irregulare TaxID=2494466 RepID=A0A9W8PEY1_9HYPO|nr:N-alpha-acetyltransferase, non-catalitic subunit [Fusarium irregulare]